MSQGYEVNVGSEYVFYCTQQQAEYYFFKFGKDAEILEPATLRSRFQKLYLEAAGKYQEGNQCP